MTLIKLLLSAVRLVHILYASELQVMLKATVTVTVLHLVIVARDSCAGTSVDVVKYRLLCEVRHSY